MLSQPERDEIAKAATIHQTVWIAMVASLMIYVGIALVIEREPTESIALMTIALAACSLAVLITIPVLRKIILNRKVPDAGLTTLIAQYRTAMIVSLGLSEAVGLFGFVLYILGQDAMTLAVFVGIALLAQLSIRPSRESLEAYVSTRATPE